MRFSIKHIINRIVKSKEGSVHGPGPRPSTPEPKLVVGKPAPLPAPSPRPIPAPIVPDIGGGSALVRQRSSPLIR